MTVSGAWCWSIIIYSLLCWQKAAEREEGARRKRREKRLRKQESKSNLLLAPEAAGAPDLPSPPALGPATSNEEVSTPAESISGIPGNAVTNANTDSSPPLLSASTDAVADGLASPQRDAVTKDTPFVSQQEPSNSAEESVVDTRHQCITGRRATIQCSHVTMRQILGLIWPLAIRRVIVT